MRSMEDEQEEERVWKDEKAADSGAAPRTRLSSTYAAAALQ